MYYYYIRWYFIYNGRQLSDNSIDYGLYSNKYPSDSNKYPSDSNNYPSDRKKYPPDSNKYLTDSNKYPSDSNKYPSDRKKYPSDSNKYPSDSNKYPSDSNKYPSDSNKYLSDSNKYLSESIIQYNERSWLYLLWPDSIYLIPLDIEPCLVASPGINTTLSECWWVFSIFLIVSNSSTETITITFSIHIMLYNKKT